MFLVIIFFRYSAVSIEKFGDSYGLTISHFTNKSQAAVVDR